MTSTPLPASRLDRILPSRPASRTTALPSSQPTSRKPRLESRASPREPAQPLGQRDSTARLFRPIARLSPFHVLAYARPLNASTMRNSGPPGTDISPDFVSASGPFPDEREKISIRSASGSLTQSSSVDAT